MAISPRLRRWLPWLAVYVVVMVGLVVWMLRTREWAVTQLSTPESIAEWEAWREDVRSEQSQPTPVQRRVPKSGEPPALVLMRDHFAVSLTGVILFASALFWTIAWFVNGIVRS
jgi:hypothetical protein